MFDGHFRQRRARKIVANRVGDDKVAVRQPLHQRAGAETIGPVIREVRLAEDVQAGHVAHQVVVDPQPAHRVMNRRVDAHRDFVRILVGDLFVHVEQVAVLLLDGFDPEALNRIAEIEVDGEPAVADAATFVADLLGVP